MSYEEAEKKRAAELTGPRYGRDSSRPLLILILIVTLAFVYLIVAPVAHLMDTNYSLTAGVGALGGLILFASRQGTYRKNHSMRGSLSLAFLDVLAWIGVIGVVVWSFVFPVIAAFPASTLLYLFYIPAFPIGMYSLTFLWAMLIVLRVILDPFTKPPSEKLYADIETSLRRLTETVAKVGLAKGPEQTVDPKLVDKVSSIMTEITAVRKELSSIKGSGFEVRPAPSIVSSVRVMASQVRTVVPKPREDVTVVKPTGGPAKAQWTETGISVPESTVDNPWLAVLSKRSDKKRSKEPEEKS